MPLCTSKEQLTFYSNNYRTFLIDYIKVTQKVKAGDKVEVVTSSVITDNNTTKSMYMDRPNFGPGHDIYYRVTGLRYYHGNRKDAVASSPSDMMLVKAPATSIQTVGKTESSVTTVAGGVSVTTADNTVLDVFTVTVSGSSYQIFGGLRRISKKNAIHIGGDILIVQRQEVKDDKFYMAYDYIRRGKAEENGYTKTKIFKMFGISSKGYYDYVARKEDRNGKLAAKRKDESYVIHQFKEIIKDLGFVPGKRTFRRHMFRRFNYKISVSRTSKIMKKMQITAQLPKKDAYKGQATHHHECMTKPNLVNRNFKLGVRQVILTDITYIHYGYYRTPA